MTHSVIILAAMAVVAVGQEEVEVVDNDKESKCLEDFCLDKGYRSWSYPKQDDRWIFHTLSISKVSFVNFSSVFVVEFDFEVVDVRKVSTMINNCQQLSSIINNNHNCHHNSQ